MFFFIFGIQFFFDLHENDITDGILLKKIKGTYVIQK